MKRFSPRADGHLVAQIHACPPKPAFVHHFLLSSVQADILADTFKVLANSTRLRLLHALCRADELCVKELSGTLNMKPQAVSNQLQRLADKGIVQSRRNGTSIYYRIIDPCVASLLGHGLCLSEDARSRRS